MFIRENHTKPATLANFRVLRSQCLETCQLRLLTLGVFLVCYVRRKESPSFREFRFRFRLRSGQERGRLRGERGLQMFLGDLHIFRCLGPSKLNHAPRGYVDSEYGLWHTVLAIGRREPPPIGSNHRGPKLHDHLLWCAAYGHVTGCRWTWGVDARGVFWMCGGGGISHPQGYLVMAP